MSDSANATEIYWVNPQLRGVFPLDQFHVSRRLARRIKQAQYTVTINQRFNAVVTACANRAETWINAEIFELYNQLHRMGFAHSVEVLKDETLVGGVYGVSINGAFFGESMFSTRRDASKIALTYLVARLNYGGFTLFDTQFQTEHLQSLGALEITRDEYHEKLSEALNTQADFLKLPIDTHPSEVLHLSNHTS
jgi:leucyl/phenylalanyl-tRNA--protein transferase